MDSAKGKAVSLVVVINRRGRADRTNRLLSQAGAVMTLCTIGRGTADTTWIDLLGLGDTEKDVHISTIATDRAPALLQQLKKQLMLDQPGTGIAFTIPVSSVGGPRTLEILLGKSEREGESA